jgi:hypothetical protein
MDVEKYLKQKKIGGEIVIRALNDLHAMKNFQNVLCVRTPTTGAWMEAIRLKDATITRILYDVSPKKGMFEHANVETYLNTLNIKFDAICMDSYHEYKESSHDFKLFASYLNDDGILLSHDCYPPKKEYATKTFKKGYWCGLTYICFVELALNNPQWYYCVVDNDNGVGILSKQPLSPLRNTLDSDKQKQLLELKDDTDAAYIFFRENSKDLINCIS